MTDALLEGKFHGLADAVLGQDQTSALIAQCWALGEASQLRDLALMATPRRP
jgi:hypothetical protein